MTDPITPPPELVQQWIRQESSLQPLATLATRSGADQLNLLATRAARWGADQELEACCALMDDWGLEESDLRAARRPKPPSLKQQAMAVLDDVDAQLGAAHYNVLLRALEALPND